MLMDQHGDDYFCWDKWGHGSSNSLPSKLTDLKPVRLEYLPQKFLSELKNGSFTAPPNVRVIRIRIFGMHHGPAMPDEPYFGLEVVSGPESKDYRPRPVEAAGGNGHTTYIQVAENIYEVY
jgi:hypothetical protein